MMVDDSVLLFTCEKIICGKSLSPLPEGDAKKEFRKVGR